MSNHVHFICVPRNAGSLSKTFNTLHMRYSQYVNRKKKLKGHLWQGCFFPCILDERHLYSAIRYVENNPVRAKFVKSAEKYHWSSAMGHVKNGTNPVLSYDCNFDVEVKDWLAYLNGVEDNLAIETIRKNTLTGRPCGDERFISRLEGLLGRKLRAMQCGRLRRK